MTLNSNNKIPPLQYLRKYICICSSANDPSPAARSLSVCSAWRLRKSKIFSACPSLSSDQVGRPRPTRDTHWTNTYSAVIYNSGSYMMNCSAFVQNCWTWMNCGTWRLNLGTYEAVEGDETRLLALFLDLCLLTHCAHKRGLTFRCRVRTLWPLRPGGVEAILRRARGRQGRRSVRERGVPGECIWSLIFHRRTHDAAVKQSEGPGLLSLTPPQQLFPPASLRLLYGRLPRLPPRSLLVAWTLERLSARWFHSLFAFPLTGSSSFFPTVLSDKNNVHAIQIT